MRETFIIAIILFIIGNVHAQQKRNSYLFQWYAPEPESGVFYSIGISHPNLESDKAQKQAKQIAEVWQSIGVSTTVAGLHKLYTEENTDNEKVTFNETWSYVSKLVSPIYDLTTSIEQTIVFPDGSVLILMENLRTETVSQLEETGILLKYFIEEINTSDSVKLEQSLFFGTKKERFLIEAIQNTNQFSYKPERVDRNLNHELIETNYVPDWFENPDLDKNEIKVAVASQPYHLSSKEGFQLSDALLIAYSKAYLSLSEKKDEDIYVMKQVLADVEKENSNVSSITNQQEDSFFSAKKTISENTLVDTEIAIVEITSSHVYLALRARYKNITDWYKQ